jgi:hypothetical protein
MATFGFYFYFLYHFSSFIFSYYLLQCLILLQKPCLPHWYPLWPTVQWRKGRDAVLFFYRIDRVQDRIIFLFYLLNFNLDFKSVHRTFPIFIHFSFVKVINVERFCKIQVLLDTLIKQSYKRAYCTDKTQLSVSFNYNLSWHLPKIVSYFVITLL